MQMRKADEGFVFVGTDAIPSCHASTIAQLPNGILAAAWFAGQEEGSPDSANYFAMRRRNEDSWQPFRLLDNVIDHAHGNPRLYLDAEKRLVVMYAVCYGRWCRDDLMYTRRSTDEAQTWSDAAPIEVGANVLGKNPPAVYADGRIVCPVTVEKAPHGAGCLISDDDGDNWRLLIIEESSEAPPLIQPTIAVLSDETLLMYLRSRRRRIWQCRSVDRGETWSTPEPTELPQNSSGLCMIRHSSGRMLLACNPTTEGRTPLAVLGSEDEGESWQQLIVLEDGAGEYSYPTIIEGLDGAVHVTYTWQRKRIKRVELELMRE